MVSQLGLPANETFREKMRKFSVAFRKLIREISQKRKRSKISQNCEMWKYREEAKWENIFAECEIFRNVWCLLVVYKSIFIFCFIHQWGSRINHSLKIGLVFSKFSHYFLREIFAIFLIFEKNENFREQTNWEIFAKQYKMNLIYNWESKFKN